MVSQCDYLVCSTPYTPDTHQLVSAAAIAAMRPNAVFINVGRGKCVDEAALIQGVLKWVVGRLQSQPARHSADWPTLPRPQAGVLSLQLTYSSTVTRLQRFAEPNSTPCHANTRAPAWLQAFRPL